MQMCEPILVSWADQPKLLGAELLKYASRQQLSPFKVLQVLVAVIPYLVPVVDTIAKYHEQLMNLKPSAKRFRKEANRFSFVYGRSRQWMDREIELETDSKLKSMIAEPFRNPLIGDLVDLVKEASEILEKELNQIARRSIEASKTDPTDTIAFSTTVEFPPIRNTKAKRRNELLYVAMLASETYLGEGKPTLVSLLFESPIFKVGSKNENLKPIDPKTVSNLYRRYKSWQKKLNLGVNPTK